MEDFTDTVAKRALVRKGNDLFNSYKNMKKYFETL